MNDLYPHGGLIGYGDSYLDNVLRYSKVFRLHLCTMLLVLCIQRRGKYRVIAIWLDVDQTGVCLVISQNFFFALIEVSCSFHIQSIQLLTKRPCDNVCRKTFLTMYFDKLRFCKFVLFYVSSFSYVYEIELNFFLCV